MATIKLGGNNVNTIGDLPDIGTDAPDFNLTSPDLEEKTKEDFSGSRIIMNIFPSIDTNVCALSVTKFNEAVKQLENTKVLAISKDLPFAQKRYTDESKLDRIVNLSDFRDGNFGKHYGVEMTTGPLRGLLSRAIIVLNESGKVIHAQQVPEIGAEPDYDAALKSLK